MAGTISTDNYTIGGAALYYDTTVATSALNTLASSGIRTSTNSFGNIVSLEMSPEVTYIDHWVSTNGKRVKDKIVENTTQININFTVDEISLENMARFFMGSTTGSVIDVLESTLDEGSAQIYFTTNIGRNITYDIPRCTIRTDGALNTNAEDWWSAPMVLEVLEYSTAQGSNATWLGAPFGKITWAA